MQLSGSLSGQPYARTTKVAAWHGVIALDLIFNNLATGIFLVAACGELTRPADFAGLARLAYPVALAMFTGELICLIVDLGDPRRFLFMLRTFKPGSPMSLGTWSLLVFSLPLTVAAGASFFQGSLWHAARIGAVVLGVLPAVAAASYKGVLLSTTAQPGWRDARWLGGYLGSSAIMLGVAVNLMAAIMAGQGTALQALRVGLMAMIVCNLVFLGLLLANVRLAVVQLYSRRALKLRGMAMLAGESVALGLLIVESPIATLAAGGLLLAVSVVLRFEIMKLPQAL